MADHYYYFPEEDRRWYSFDSICEHFRHNRGLYWLILTGILFALFMYLFSLILVEPDYHFQIDLIHTTVSSDDGNGTFRSNFTFSIPKLFRTKTIQYNFDSVSLFQDEKLISNTTMSPVFQPDRNTTRVEAEFVLSPNLTQISEVVEWAVDIEATLTLGPDTYCNSLDCIFRGNQRRIDTPGNFPERKRSARVRCTHVKVDFSANSTDLGRLLNPPRSCLLYYDNSRIW